MAKTRNAAPGGSGNGVSEFVFAAERDSFENSTTADHFQYIRTGQPISLGQVSERIVTRLARRCQISNSHARTVAELADIGGAD